jgi:hypothetical protein
MSLQLLNYFWCIEFNTSPLITDHGTEFLAPIIPSIPPTRTSIYLSALLDQIFHPFIASLNPKKAILVIKRDFFQEQIKAIGGAATK